MIDFNKQLNSKDLVRIVIPSIFLIASIIIYFILTKPLSSENNNLNTEVNNKKEEILSLKSKVKNLKVEDSKIEDIEMYDKYIDNITDLLINKNYISGKIEHEKLDPTENLFPCIVKSSLTMNDLSDVKLISDDLKNNLIAFDAKKTNGKWIISSSNLYTMDKFYGLRDIYINNEEGQIEETKDKDSNKEDVTDSSKKDNKNEIESKDKNPKDTVSRNAISKTSIDKKENFIEYNFLDVNDEDFLFAPLKEGINYDYLVRNIKGYNNLIINAFNNGEEDGDLEIEFSKFNRIIWQSGGKISFEFNSLGGENPNLKLKFIDSHESEVIINPDFDDDKVNYDLSNINNYPIFLKSFIVSLDKNDRRHFMISNGDLFLNEKDIKSASWTKKLFSAPSFGCSSIDELFEIYNNNHNFNFLVNNGLNKKDYLTAPSYIFESKDAYEIFKKN